MEEIEPFMLFFRMYIDVTIMENSVGVLQE